MGCGDEFKRINVLYGVIMVSDIQSNLECILSCKYEFNSDDYADVLNHCIFVDKIENPLYYLEKMSEHKDYSVIFALSFILEHASRKFLKEHNNQISDIVIKALTRNYSRANFYFAETLLFTMQREKDYLAYVNLLIKSKYDSVQDIALMHLLDLTDDKLEIFNNLANDMDFSYLYSYFDDFDKYLSAGDKSSISLLQKKIICMAYYKKYQDKSKTYNLFGENNPELFEFIFFLP